ncbi:MAG: DUF2752 domain-containing protein [Bacteroidota bacterium]
MESPQNRFDSKPWLWAKLAFYAAVPLVLLLLPADFFDTGQPLCASRLLFGVECLGCGMTRSIMHLIHLEFAVAYSFNPLGFVAFPLLVWLWLRWALRDFKRLRSLA